MRNGCFEKIKMIYRYALLTVDTETLPRRSIDDHVNRLIWGEHYRGSAGIREVCAMGDEFNAKHVFFIDLCSAYAYLDEMIDVVRWLDLEGQDVQLHAHPEILPDNFWSEKGYSCHPPLMNQYEDNDRAKFVISYFGKSLSAITNKKVVAFRAGSFRWNASTIRALHSSGIPLSFNNSMRAFCAGKCVFSEPTNYPYRWSNGIIEIPVTEKLIPPYPGGKEFWATLTFPESPYYPFQTERNSFLSRVFGSRPAFSVFLLHSWSMLYWDENGHATYRDDQRLEAYRKLLSRLTKDYDVITTKEFLDLHTRGKIPITKTVNLDLAECMQ